MAFNGRRSGERGVGESAAAASARTVELHHGRGTVGTAPYLDPVVLARIGDLSLVARVVVEGFISGLHRSPRLGFSTDFAEHRQYTPGDDIRHIDWKVYARTDRFYLKEFEADTNTNFLVLLDVSQSMAFGSAGISKLEYAKFLAASLLYLSHGQRDRVGLVTFDSDIVDYVPPSAKHLEQCLHMLDRSAARGRGTLAGPLLKVSESQRRRSIVLLLSDLYEPPDVVRDALAPLRDAGHDLVVMHVLDLAELEFPFDAAATFRDMESGERLPVVPPRVRKVYLEQMRRHVESVERLLGEGRVDYVLVNTSRPLDEILFEYLVRRERLQTAR